MLLIFIIYTNFYMITSLQRITAEKMVKIYVGNLSDNVTNTDLRNLFEQFGPVEEAERVRGRPIGFVHMPSEQMATDAVR